jgi:hypothetical protein
MITKLLLEGALKIVSIRKDSNKTKRVAQVYSPREAAPELILKETEPNMFKDMVNGILFKLTNEGMVKVAEA